MDTLSANFGKFDRLGRIALATVLGIAAAACSTAREPAHKQPGELELSVVGVSHDGARYRVQGRFTVAGVDNGLYTHVSSDENPAGAVVRRRLPPGLYSVTLNPDFQLAPLTTGSNEPEPGAPPLALASTPQQAPKLVLVAPDQRAQVLIQSVTPALQAEHPLAVAR